MDLPTVHQFKDLTSEKCKKILIQSLCNMLTNCKERPVFRVLSLVRINDEQVEKALEAAEIEIKANQCNNVDSGDVDQMDTSLANHSGESVGVSDERGFAANDNESDDLLPDVFHERLIINDFQTIEEVEKFYSDNFKVLSNRFGVLLFLYSVLFTKGIESILNEVSDTSEPLIHSSFGYGSQSLINLMLTGKAVAHVFDNEQEIGGMKLKGIASKSEIGFMTLMEKLRYCTVGANFKNPKYAIWVLASETHLTVLFSDEKSLVSQESGAEIARRVFSQYDNENTGFIASAVLQDILSVLGLESDPDYVEIMKRKLDPDSTSIVLLSDFMYEFFPDDKKSTPDTFDLFHYNGIPNSNENHKVNYKHGKAILLETHTTDMFSPSNSMLTCLQTKWPNIEVNWNQDRVPSLN